MTENIIPRNEINQVKNISLITNKTFQPEKDNFVYDENWIYQSN